MSTQGTDTTEDFSIESLAQMNDLYLSRELSRVAREEIKDDSQYLALCREVTHKRYKLLSEKQKGTSHKEAAFNQVVRNTDFAPRGLLETYMAKKLEEVDNEEGSEYKGQRKIDVLFDLAKKIQNEPSNDQAVTKLAQMIDKYYPEEILEAVLPTYNDYLENENEDNYLNVAQKKAKEEGKEIPDESPHDKHKRRAPDFCGQLLFMIESNIMAKGKDTAEKTDLAKVFIKVRAKRSTGLTERMDKVRIEKNEDYEPTPLDSTDNGPEALIKKNSNKIRNKAYLNEIKAEAKKNETTLFGVREQNVQKNQEFKLANRIELLVATARIEICEAIESGKIDINGNLTPAEYEKAVNDAIDNKLKEIIPNHLELAIRTRDKVAIEKALKGFLVPKSIEELIGVKGKLEDFKTTDYKRSFLTAVQDTFKSIGKSLASFKFTNPFKKPERSLKEVLTLGQPENETIRDMLTTIERFSKPHDAKETLSNKENIQLEIEKLKELGETKHFSEPTFAQKWIAKLYHEVSTNKNLDEKSQRALIDTLNVLKEYQNFTPDINDADFAYNVKPLLNDVLNALGEGKAQELCGNLIRDLMKGEQASPPDLIAKLTTTLSETQQQEQDPMPEISSSQTYRGSVSNILEKVQKVAEKWIESLDDFSREQSRQNDLSPEENEAIRYFRGLLSSVDKSRNSTELDNKLSTFINDCVRDNDGKVRKEVIDKLQEARMAIREGKPPELTLAQKWISELEKVDPKPTGVDKEIIDRVANLLTKSIVNNPTEFKIVVNEEITKKGKDAISENVVRLLNKVKEGIIEGKEPEVPKQDRKQKLN